LEVRVVTVKRSDLSSAFEFVSSAPPSEHVAYVSLDTGKIYWLFSDGAPDDEEVPDDLEVSDRYIAIPHQSDLDLGSQLAVRFADERLPERAGAIREIFRHRGAYRRFRDVLEAEGRLDQWRAFEEKATEEALRDWCEANEIHLV
jgi:hypothetical protein